MSNKTGNSSRASLIEGIVIALLVIIVGCMLFLYFSFSVPDSVADLFGYKVFRTMQTNMQSTEKGKGIDSGSAVFGKVSEKASIHPGSVVLCSINESTVVARVNEVIAGEDEKSYLVSFDSNQNDTYEIADRMVIATVLYQSAPFGALLGFVTSTMGMMLIIIIPSFIVILIQAAKIIGEKNKNKLSYEQAALSAGDFPEETLLPAEPYISDEDPDMTENADEDAENELDFTSPLQIADTEIQFTEDAATAEDKDIFTAEEFFAEDSPAEERVYEEKDPLEGFIPEREEAASPETAETAGYTDDTDFSDIFDSSDIFGSDLTEDISSAESAPEKESAKEDDPFDFFAADTGAAPFEDKIREEKAPACDEDHTEDIDTSDIFADLFADEPAPVPAPAPAEEPAPVREESTAKPAFAPERKQKRSEISEEAALFYGITDLLGDNAPAEENGNEPVPEREKTTDDVFILSGNARQETVSSAASAAAPNTADDDFFMSAPVKESDIRDEEIRKLIPGEKKPAAAEKPKKPAVKRKKKKSYDINGLLSMIDESEKKL